MSNNQFLSFLSPGKWIYEDTIKTYHTLWKLRQGHRDIVRIECPFL